MSTILRARRAAPVAAVALGVLALGLQVASVSLGLLAGQPVSTVTVRTIAVVPGAVVATILAARRPRNPIGWLLIGISLVVAASALPVHDHGTLPLGWGVLDSTWPVELVAIAILIWLFPDGLPRGRWRRTSVVLLISGTALGLAAWAGGGVAVAEHRYQLGSANLGNAQVHADGALGIPAGLALFAAAVSLLVWLILLVPRYRRSPEERRLQLKWLYTGAVIAVASLVASSVAQGQASAFWHAVGVITSLGGAALAVCIGVAVLKYRLYEIDRIISRVISYAIITAVLAGVFAGLVLLATVVLPFKTPVAVAAATLAAAALFNPLRKRVQHAVDRRFNRTRYNTEAIVAAFTARLRQTVDLDTVRGDLLGVVHGAFQPAHVSIWLTGDRQQAPVLPGRRHPDLRSSAGQQHLGWISGWESGQMVGRTLDAPENGWPQPVRGIRFSVHG